MQNRGTELSTLEDWDSSWSAVPVESIRFDPTIPIYRDMNRVLTRVLPRDPSATFLEVGAYPGYMMWYFHEHFGYRVEGLEFVPWCCARARQLLQKEGIDAQIIEADLFEYQPEHGNAGWDVVASNGFIEHFADPRPVVARHLDLVKPGGVLVLIVPNHATLYGRIMKRLRPDRYAIHNQMTLAETVAAIEATGNARLVHASHIGRFGFWNCGLYETVHARGRVPYVMIRAPLWLVEHVAQWIVPNSRRFSPSFIAIAQRVR